MVLRLQVHCDLGAMVFIPTSIVYYCCQYLRSGQDGMTASCIRGWTDDRASLYGIAPNVSMALTRLVVAQRISICGFPQHYMKEEAMIGDR